MHDIQNVYMCTSFGVCDDPLPPNHPAQWAKSLGVINHLKSLSLSLNMSSYRQVAFLERSSNLVIFVNYWNINDFSISNLAHRERSRYDASRPAIVAPYLWPFCHNVHIFHDKACKTGFIRLPPLHEQSGERSGIVCLLVTVLLQILLCANDIEMNPGPSESETETVSSDSETDMKAYMQDLLEHQEVRIQTLLQQLNVRFGVLENHLTEKIDESMTAVKTEIEALHAKTCQLENYCCAALQETESTKAAVTELEDRMLKISADLDDKIDRLEVFSRRDNLKFFNVPMSVSNENYADRADKIADILSDRKRVHVCFERYKQHAQAANFKIGTRPGPCLY